MVQNNDQELVEKLKHKERELTELRKNFIVEKAGALAAIRQQCAIEKHEAVLKKNEEIAQLIARVQELEAQNTNNV